MSLGWENRILSSQCYNLYTQVLKLSAQHDKTIHIKADISSKPHPLQHEHILPILHRLPKTILMHFLACLVQLEKEFWSLPKIHVQKN